MAHAFAKDSRSCAACVSWSGQRSLAADNTLVEVERYSLEAECRAAASGDYRRFTKAYHTCERWAPLPLLKAHGARPSRVVMPPSPPPAALGEAGEVRDALPAPAAMNDGARSLPIEIDKAPQPAQAVYAHWHRLKQEAGFPPARVFDPSQVRAAVPRLALLISTPDGADFVYRACGKAIARCLPGRPVGKRLGDCHPPEAAALLRADASACLGRGAPICQLIRRDPIAPGVRFVELLLPLADENKRAAFVLLYRHLPGG